MEPIGEQEMSLYEFGGIEIVLSQSMKGDLGIPVGRGPDAAMQSPILTVLPAPARTVRLALPHN